MGDQPTRIEIKLDHRGLWAQKQRKTGQYRAGSNVPIWEVLDEVLLESYEELMEDAEVALHKKRG